MRGLIFLGGDAPSVTLSRREAALSQWIIAADSGLVAAHAAGIVPNLVVGDFDSVPPDLLDNPAYDTLRLPAQKDQTDGEEALDRAIAHGCEEIVMLGGLGGRLDHQLANVTLLARAHSKGVRACLLSESSRVQCFGEGITRINGKPGDLLSLFPMGEQALFADTQGLQYPLRNSALIATECRGISNVFTRHLAVLDIAQGMVTAIHMWDKPE